MKPINEESVDKKNKKSSLQIKRPITTKKPSSGKEVSPRESKYPTRNKTRAQDCQESSNNESKRAQLSKKQKEKEAQKKPPLPMPNLPGMVHGMSPLVPFQFMQPGSQGPMLGMFPMMQNAQK